MGLTAGAMTQPLLPRVATGGSRERPQHARQRRAPSVLYCTVVPLQDVPFRFRQCARPSVDPIL